MAPQDVRIAVVDDERFFRDAICEILQRADFACVAGDDASSALALAADDSIGVMVLDVRVPGREGLDVLRELRASRPELQVIVLSSSVDQETVLEALRIGACDYLAKPLHDEELLLAVGRAAEVHALAAGSAGLRAQLGQLVKLCGELARAADLAGDERDAYLRQAAAHGVAELLGAEKTSLMLLADSGEELHVVAAVTPGIATEEMDPVAIGHGVAGIAFERAEALLRQKGEAADGFTFEPVPGRYRSDSFVVAPLAVGDRSFGVLCATEPVRDRGFDATDLALLQLFADRLTSLFAGTREEKDGSVPHSRDDSGVAPDEPGPSSAESDAELDSELVRQICEALVNDVDPERVIRGVLRPIERELGAAPVSLHLLDGATGTLRCEGQLDGGARADRTELPTSQGLTGTVLQTGHLVATRTPEMDPRYDPEVDTPEDGRPGPLLCVPLSLRGQVIGLCRVFLPEGAAASARTAEALAAVLSAAVRNVLLYRSLVESIEELADARRQARS